MRLQGRDLHRGMTGDDVRLLQRELQTLGFGIPAVEADGGSFGEVTAQIVMAFQSQQGLPANGVVDEPTARHINAAVDEAQPQPFSVRGRVRLQAGDQLPDARVVAVDRDLRGEEFLGEAVTDERGQFEIPYSADQFARAEVGRADLVLRVLDAGGRELAVSDTFFNAPPVLEVDLVVVPREEPAPSEYEQLLADLAPVLDGVEPAELTADDLDFLEAETGLDRNRMALLAEGARLGLDTGLPSEATYGWGRLEVPLTLESLLDREPEELRQVLERAIEAGIVPLALRESLDAIAVRLQQLSIEHGVLVAREVSGRLVEEETAAPLPGYMVRGADLDAGAEPTGIGGDVSDGAGRFTLTYFAPRPLTPGEGEDAEEAGRRLRLHVFTPAGEEIHQAEVAVPPDQEEVIEVRVPVPAAEDRSLEDLAAAANLDLPTELVSALAGHGVRTLADVRRHGGIRHLDGVDPDHPAVPVLEGHARLSVLSADTAATAALIDAGYPSVPAVAGATRSEFVSGTAEALGDFGAARLRAGGSAGAQFLNSVVAGFRADLANLPAPSSAGSPAAEVAALFPPPCGCRDCEAAVSPLAYLAELLGYTLGHVKRRNAQGSVVPVTLAGLGERFHQPFGELPASCGTVEGRLRQARVCIEVLRRHLAATGTDAQALAEAERGYLMAAYTGVLTGIGTSYEELPLARTATEDARQDLADRLGLPTSTLDALLLDPDSASGQVEVLTEGALERLFGLVETALDRHPLAQGPTVGADRERIVRWSLDVVVWARHTDPDGFIHARLTNPTPAVFRVELFRDAGRAELVASGERSTAQGPVTVVGEDGRLAGSVHIDFLADTDDLAILAVPRFLAWRLQHLRALWQDQDWPEDPYTDGADPPLPVIDPDVIGPDDLRRPHPGDAAFDVWLVRRDWVDERLQELAGLTKTATDAEGNTVELPDMAALFDRMSQPLTYGTAVVTPWAAATPPAVFSDLRDQLAAGTNDEVDAAVERLWDDLHLGVDEFVQLLAVRDHAAAWEADPRGEPASDEDWRAALSILVQAQKRALHPAWLDEDQDRDVTLDLKQFRMSLRDPEAGAWPPPLLADRPLVDPDLLDARALAEPTVAQDAIDLLARRREELTAVSQALKETHETSGFDALLRQALGHPLPGDALPHDLDNLQAQMTGGDAAAAAEARSRIEADLCLSVADFQRLMAVKAKADHPDPAARPSAAEAAEVYAMLTTARKVKHDYGRWRSEEQAGGLVYWNVLKARLPPWRASVDVRGQWQQALTRRSQPPHVDPDLVRPADLADPGSGAAAALWQARRDVVDAQLAVVEGAAKDLAGFDQAFQDVVGVPAAELETLDAQRRAGVNIGPRLEQLQLDPQGFDYLLRVRRLVEAGAPVSDEEWSDVAAILTQAHKRREFGAWREEERHGGVTLGPDHFTIPEPPPLVFPPPEPQPLPAWLASQAARRAWRDRLQARIDQQQRVTHELQAVVDAVEEQTLPRLRDGLLLAGPAGTTLEDKATDVTDGLLIDARGDGCQVTSRAAQAIETLQLLLWSLRIGRLTHAHPDLLLDDDDFDEAWAWLGSYEAWRAAMFVFLYPENVLLPSLRRWQTPAFRALVDHTRRNAALTPADACHEAAAYADYFRDVCTLTLEASVVARTDAYADPCRARAFEGDHRHLAYLFATGGATRTVYYSRYDPDDDGPYAQGFWTPVPGVERGSEVIGAAAYATSNEERFVHLFVRAPGDQAARPLLLARFDLAGDRWAGEPTDLEPPDGAAEFTVVVKQRNRDDEPPQLAIHVRGGPIYARRLNPAGGDWEAGGWQPLVPHAKAREFATVEAMIEPTPGEFYLVARRHNGVLVYRLFGGHDDGHWRQLGQGARQFDPQPGSYGPWLGGFPWPDSPQVYLFWRTSPTARSPVFYVGLQRPRNLGTQSRSSISTFDDWLREVAGLTLAGLVIVGKDTSLLDFFASYEEKFAQHTNPQVKGPAERKAKELINTLAGQLENGTEPGWDDWQAADGLVAQFNTRRSTLAETLRALVDGEEVRFKSRAVTNEQRLHHDAFLGLQRIVLATGQAPSALPGRMTYQQQLGGPLEEAGGLAAPAPGMNAGPAFGLEPRMVFVRSTFDHNLTERRLTPVSKVDVAPFVTEPFEITERLSADQLQTRRQQIRRAFDGNAGAPASVLTYLDEAYYFVPVHLALQLEQRGHFVAALDWLRTVYDYTTTAARRKISHYLTQEASLGSGFVRVEEWWLDPLNPHAIARIRASTYTRFTLLSLVRCLLAFADAEFTRDTAESLPRARTLYTAALELLGQPELQQALDGCDDLIGVLDIDVAPQLEGFGRERALWDQLVVALRRIQDPAALHDAVADVRQILASGNGIAERLVAARRTVRDAIAAQPDDRALSQVLAAKHQAVELAHDRLLRHPAIARAAARISTAAGEDLLQAVAAASGTAAATVAAGGVRLPWLHLRAEALAPAGAGSPDGGGGTTTLGRAGSVAVAPRTARVGTLAPLQAVKLTRRSLPTYLPATTFRFCVPPNPVVAGVRLHAEVNLHKIRTCRNIAGDLRQIDPYAAPTDVEAGMPAIGGNGQLALPRARTRQPTPYRYPVLIERAKQLVGHAQQLEAAFLSTLEKRDAEAYQLLKARQDLGLARAGVRLQDLRVTEAEGGVQLSELQRERAQIQVDHYHDLLSGSVLDLMENVGAFLSAATAAGAAAATGGASGGSFFGSLLGSTASLMRRRQEWGFGRDLARQDVAIGTQEIRLSRQRLRIVGQERTIARLHTDHADNTLEFLATKFANVELYDWMSGVLEGVYRFFLQQATSVAMLAEHQLGFERQEMPPAMIQTDYWEALSPQPPSSDGGAPDRRGMTGSTRLLQDLFRLDQYAFDTEKRKLQLTKTISLARMAPVEFQRFRTSGVLRFDTPTALFDRDFPGHYLRLIKRVRTSVIALIPPTEGIKATLSTTGLSRVVAGSGGLFQPIRVNRPPESVALSAPTNAGGLFELDLSPEASQMLLPFEAMGVDTAWELQLPRAANPFDFASIADVLLTIDYTALGSFAHRQQVIRELDDRISADRPFSFRQEFADAFYDLHNPDQTDTPMVVGFRTRRQDFPPNIHDVRIQHVTLFFARAEGPSFEVPVTHLRFRPNGSGGQVGGGGTTIDGTLGTLRGNAGSWTAMVGKAPFGAWELALPNTAEMRNLFKQESITDILLVVTFSGRTSEWPM